MENVLWSILLQFLLGTHLDGELVQDVAAADQVVELLWRKASLADQTLKSLRLLLDISGIVGKLVEDFDVVVCVLVLEARGGLGDLVGDGGQSLASSEFGDQGVESGDGAGESVEATSGNAVGTGLVVEVVDEDLLGAAAFVGNRFLGAVGEELDGRVGLDALLLTQSL